jgi:hypothetical protein
MRPDEKRGKQPDLLLPSSRLTYVTAKLPAITPVAVAVTTASAVTEVIALRPRLGLVNGQSAAVELCAVQRRNGTLGLAARAHLDKAEAAGLTGEFIRDYGRRLHRAVRREDFL